jgi:FKBP-type peptidyl-prolyl cis-trans isomerase 2
MAKVHLGSVVSFYYKGGVKGEEASDIRLEGEPLTVMIGDMKIPRGLESALMDMEPGEEKNVEIPAELGYGEYQEELAQWYPKAMLDQGYTLKVGDVMFHRNPSDGSRQPAFVTELTADQARIDLNHPFAGKDLEYWVKVEEVK